MMAKLNEAQLESEVENAGVEWLRGPFRLTGKYAWSQAWVCVTLQAKPAGSTRDVAWLPAPHLVGERDEARALLAEAALAWAAG